MRDCLEFFVNLTGIPTEELSVDNVPVVRGYANVFPEDAGNVDGDEWQDVAKMVYNLLWAFAVPILLQDIDYKAFCVELTALWGEAWGDALEFLEAERVPSEMRISEDAPSHISDIEE
ncbi:hypothetical protein Adt_31709 [Abeliophyllum distichum]|uniref:Uncharacterized protein n=1 Tax=Abeliophyllum distichum TaxID=126358 RepID=A0ABD1RGN7_9LAMI